jgi:hypothetical protein
MIAGDGKMKTAKDFTMKILTVAQLLAFVIAVLAGAKAPQVCLAALVSFFLLNSALYYLKARGSMETPRRIVNTVTAVSSLASPTVLLAYMTVHGII